MNSKPPVNSNRQFFLRYASLGTQLVVALGLSVFIGLKTDNWMKTSPLLACVLPLLTLIGIFYKLMRDTAKPTKNEDAN